MPHIPRLMEITPILSVLLTAIIILVSILIVLVVLVQRPKQEGLGAAFGGGAFDSALGAHTTDVLQKITTYLAIIFFASSIGLAMVKSREFTKSAANDVLEQVDEQDEPAPVLPPVLDDAQPDAPAPAPAAATEDAPAPAPAAATTEDAAPADEPATQE